MEKQNISTQTKDEKKSVKQSFWELVRFALIAIAIVIPIRLYIAQPFIVSGSSMVPTFLDGQYLIVDEISYRLNEPKRNDIIVFKYPKDTTKFFIKRIIGLPNETIDIEGETIMITNEEHSLGFKLEQPYIKNISNDNKHYKLKNNEYYVMGDNRPASSDSRDWGPVSKNLIIGKVLLRLFPINKIDILPGNYKQIE